MIHYGHVHCPPVDPSPNGERERVQCPLQRRQGPLLPPRQGGRTQAVPRQQAGRRGAHWRPGTWVGGSGWEWVGMGGNVWEWVGMGGSGWDGGVGVGVIGCEPLDVEISHEPTHHFLQTAEEFLKYLDETESHYAKYQELLDKGVSRELARIGLPVSVYTEWYWKVFYWYPSYVYPSPYTM